MQTRKVMARPSSVVRLHMAWTDWAACSAEHAEVSTVSSTVTCMLAEKSAITVLQPTRACIFVVSNTIADPYISLPKSLPKNLETMQGLLVDTQLTSCKRMIIDTCTQVVNSPPAHISSTISYCLLIHKLPVISMIMACNL